MLCVNCEQPAVWLFKSAGVKPQPYCNPHLPAAYRGTKNVSSVEVSDSLPVEAAPEAPQAQAWPEVKAKRAAKKAAPVDETA